MSGLQNARSPDRADFDWRGFAARLRRQCFADGRGLRAIAAEAGVTASDLSRATGGQMVSVAKVLALCDWCGAELRDFYLAPEGPAGPAGPASMKSSRCSGSHVKQESLEDAR